MFAKLVEKDFPVKWTINIPKLPVITQGTVKVDIPKATGMEIRMTGLRLANHVRENMMVQTGALARMHPSGTWIDNKLMAEEKTWISKRSGLIGSLKDGENGD